MLTFKLWSNILATIKECIREIHFPPILADISKVIKVVGKVKAKDHHLELER